MTRQEDSQAGRKWFIRQGGIDDGPAIIDLLRLVFRDDLSEEQTHIEHWRWKYQEHPHHMAGVFVAEDSSEIVGHYGCLPMRYRSNKGDFLVSVAVDAMVHPEYRLQGMFTSLSEYALDSMKERGFPVSIGFTASGRASQVLPGHFKVGFREIGNVPVLGRPLKMGNVSQAKLGNRLHQKLAEFGLRFLYATWKKWEDERKGKEIIVREMSDIDFRFDRLWERAKSAFSIVSQRKADFLRYRFLDCPVREYQLLGAFRGNELMGYLVLRFFRRFGLDGALIIDLFHDSSHPEVAGRLLDECRNVAESRDADILAMMCSGSSIKAMLKKKGFIETGESYNFIVRRNDSDFENRCIFDFEEWFITWADFDVL